MTMKEEKAYRRTSRIEKMMKGLKDKGRKRKSAKCGSQRITILSLTSERRRRTDLITHRTCRSSQRFQDPISRDVYTRVVEDR